MKKLLLIISIPILLISLSGCTFLGINFGGEKSPIGIFKSTDFGASWQPSNLIRVDDKKTLTLDSVSVRKIVLDPNDHTRVYAVTMQNGIWFSKNSADNWSQIWSGSSSVDFAVDPKKSGVIYLTTGKQIYKTLDLGENWTKMHVESRADIYITHLAIDPFNNLIVYAGTTSGEVFKTNDGGESWQIFFRITDQGIKRGKILKLLVNPRKHGTLYLATDKGGIFKTSDAGTNWENLNQNFYDYNDKTLRKEFKGIDEYQELILDPTQIDALIYASNFGLTKSNDGGQNWETVQLLTPPSSVAFISLAINPQDNQQIYYSTGNAYFKSFDGGKNWLTAGPPTNHLIKHIIVDYETPNVVYMGMLKVEKKGIGSVPSF